MSSVPPSRLPELEPLAPSLRPGHLLPMSTGRMLAIAFAAAAVIFLISLSLDWLVVREQQSSTLAIEVSDLLAAIVTGGLVFRLLQYERERRRQIRQRLETIADMNHHIRNALQVISGTAYSAADQQQLSAIRESVHRIQWALREILPKL